MDLFLSSASDLGIFVVQKILALAGILVEEQVPGLVSGGFGLFLIITLFMFWIDSHKVLSAIQTVQETIEKAEDEESFSLSYVKIQAAIKKMSLSKGRRSRIIRAWQEFSETLILPSDNSRREIIKNTCRPNTFFNREDLHLQYGIWRQLPSIFVSLGLLATFLGLISALNEASGSLSDSGPQDALFRLLNVATAKFIMSLTGLACSIIFNIFFRARSSKIDRKLLDLCEAVEDRVRYQTSEMLALEQLHALKTQGQALQTFSNDLVANLGRALREELPQNIKTSIAEAIAPVAESIKDSSTEGVNEMVNSISDRLAGGFDSALQSVSETLLTVGTSLDFIANRMDSSSGKMGEEMDGAVKQLSSSIVQLQHMMKESSETASDTINNGANKLLASMNEALEGIKQNTAESSIQLEQAANKISNAAERFNDAIEEVTSAASADMKQKLEGVTGDIAKGINSVGVSVASSMSDAVVLITKEAGHFSEAMANDLTKPVNDLRLTMESLNNSISSNADKIRHYSTVIEQSSKATSTANDILSNSATAFANVVDPIRASIEQAESAAKHKSQSVSDASRVLVVGVEKTNSATVRAIEHANEAFIMSRNLVDQSLSALNLAVGKFGDVVERYDTIDENLGKAFTEIKISIRGSIDEMSKFTRELHDQYEEALTTLRAVVEMNNPFDPQSNK